MMEENAPKKKNVRRAHKKSHLGCKNCKQRRIKCNEELPICGQCSKSKIKCSYLSLTEEEIAVRRRNKMLAAAQLHEQQRTQTAAELHKSRLPSPPPTSHIAPNPVWSIGTTSSGTTSSSSNFNSTPNFNPNLANGMVSSHSSTPPAYHHHHHSPGSHYGYPPAPAPPPPLPPLPKLPLSSGPGPVQLPPLQPPRDMTPPSSLPSINETLRPMLPPKGTPRQPMVRHGFETDMMRTAYIQWMNMVMDDAYAHAGLYHALMAFSYGFIGSATGRINTRESDKHRFIALHELQEDLAKDKLVNVDAVVASSLVLSWDAFFQDDNIQSYITLSKGLAAVLEKVQGVSPTPTTSCMTDALFQGIKSIYMPPYDARFFGELRSNIKILSAYIATANSSQLFQDYENLNSYVDQVYSFLYANPTRRFNASSTGASYHSPAVLFSFLRQWIKTFPSRALALEKSYTETPEVVLYAYYHAVTRSLDSLFPEVRYMYQFGFLGPIDLTGIEAVLVNVTPIDRLAYPLKLLNFFRERTFLLNRLLLSKSHWSSSYNSSIQEVPVLSFEHTALGPEHYPTSSLDTSSVSASSSSASSATTSSVVSGSRASVVELPSSSASIVRDATSISSSATSHELNSADLDIFKRYYEDRLEIFSTI
ncbi:hypothetical protein TRVA0_077S00188 [Trichomonascus vanleenenianus]|uniref:Zn(II)2Cys6 transcription factor domain-containing protein n=1 Tax=Trichomonascus vanleenenianus TaxID=2268995 RepID=UPI003ECA1FFC